MIKAKMKNWVQKKISNLNDLFANKLAKKFSCICRAEYLNNCAQNCSEVGVVEEKYCDSEVIVSLTTYGMRLYEVYLAIESIMQQTLKPNRIILWLSDEMKNITMPLVLQNQQKRGLEIRYCKDIGSYTKLIPALKAFPSAAIITIDDDHIYHFDVIENLVNAYKNNPALIHCARMHKMKLLNNAKLEKYRKWTYESESFDVSPLNFPTGNGGVLYPPGSFNKEVFNENVFMDICKYADDVWFKTMALLHGTMAKKIFTHNKKGNEHLEISNTQYSALSKINIHRGMNDVQLKAVFDKYNLYDKLTAT